MGGAGFAAEEAADDDIGVDDAQGDHAELVSRAALVSRTALSSSVAFRPPPEWCIGAPAPPHTVSQDPPRRVCAGRHGAINMTAETLRKWVRQAETDQGLRPGLSGTERERVKELEREVRELRRANEILKAAAAFFGALQT